MTLCTDFQKAPSEVLKDMVCRIKKTKEKLRLPQNVYRLIGQNLNYVMVQLNGGSGIARGGGGSRAP